MSVRIDYRVGDGCTYKCNRRFLLWHYRGSANHARCRPRAHRKEGTGKKKYTVDARVHSQGEGDSLMTYRISPDARRTLACTSPHCRSTALPGCASCGVFRPRRECELRHTRSYDELFGSESISALGADSCACVDITPNCCMTNPRKFCCAHRSTIFPPSNR